MGFSFNGLRGRKDCWSLGRSRGEEISVAVRSVGLEVGYDPWFIWEQADELLVDPRRLVELLRRVERAGTVGESIDTELLIRLAAMSLRCGAHAEWLAYPPFGDELAYAAISLEKRYQRPTGYQGLEIDESLQVDSRLERFERDGLVELDLSGLGLTELPDVDLAGVVSLNLSRNNFVRVPPGLSSLSGLTDLDLSYNSLDGDLTVLADCGLQNLSLEGCQLSEFAIERSDRLTALVVLNLSHNPLVGQGPLGGMSSLMSLNLSGTGISVIPERIGECSQLRSLNLSWNQIEDVSALASAPDLSLLSLDGNRIETLPESLFALADLYQLQAGCNRLTEAAVANAMSSLSLRYLFLEKNLIDPSLIDQEFLADRLERVSFGTGIEAELVADASEIFP